MTRRGTTAVWIEDEGFLNYINMGLHDGRTLQEMADDMGVSVAAVSLRIRQLGYKIAKRLVPVERLKLAKLN